MLLHIFKVFNKSSLIYRVIYICTLCIISHSCSTSKLRSDEYNNSEKKDQYMSWGVRDSALVDEKPDFLGDGVFGRKIVYRDLTATKAAISCNGRVATKVCINRAGNVIFVELIPGETTIEDKNTLKSYLKAVRGYKFQPDLTAPKEQCGKLSFSLYNPASISGLVFSGDKDNDSNAEDGKVNEGTGDYDSSGDGVFGRKIVFRDLSATKAAIAVSGRVVTKICINRAGNVTFVELIPGETTVRDKNTLKLYMKAARGYKFQPDLTAPKEQCGKLSFKADNTVNNRLK